MSRTPRKQPRSYEMDEPEITLPVEAVDVIVDALDKAQKYDELMERREHNPVLRFIHRWES